MTSIVQKSQTGSPLVMAKIGAKGNTRYTQIGQKGTGARTSKSGGLGIPASFPLKTQLCVEAARAINKNMTKMRIFLQSGFRNFFIVSFFIIS